MPVIRVETDKSLYRPGESIKVNVTASRPGLRTIVDVARESEIIESRSLTLQDGSATFTLRYRPGFRDEVSITAFSRSAENSDYNFPVGSKTVLFPRNRDLNVNFRMDRTEYKPGEEATVDFSISTPDGRPASTALGVVVFDRAVEERARTDQEFGGRFGFQGNFSQWRGYENQIGGFSRKELQQIDLTKPLPDEMELVAELLLADRSQPFSTFEAETFDLDPHEVFANAINSQINHVGRLLENQYKAVGLYPESGAGFRRLLFETGHNFASLGDPWGMPYRDVFSIDGDDHVFEIFSAGPDKQFGSKDDFSVARIARPYFRFTGEAISRAVERFHVRTGEFIRDTPTLRNELRREGIDLGSISDPWGQPYEISFTTNKTLLNLVVSASGPNGRHEIETANSDDVQVWVASIDYMTETRAQMEKALSQYFEKTQDLPPNDNELRLAFTTAGIEQSRLLDPWGRRYFGVFKTESRHEDRLVIQDVAMYGQPAKNRSQITPVKQHVKNIELFSSGEDGRQGTGDDFHVAVFSRLMNELVQGVQGTPTGPMVPFSGAKGAIKGTILDLNGAVVAGAKVKATQKTSAREFEAVTDDSGVFILRNLPVGLYEVRCDSPGFQTAVVMDVPVSSFNITSINFTLQPGSVTETVTVTGGVENNMMLETSSSSVTTKGGTIISIGHAPQMATPRLREYFPETLVWQPLLETDRQGQAQLKFKLADNITTWKMSVISSTEDGEIGMAEKEIKAFQPFFVEHDPPRVLTEGDQIALPVVLRNYLERAQIVDVEIKPESWFSLQGPASQRANVAAGDSARPTFLLTALASVKDGKQRVTARGSDASDAIEKSVTVHPDGEEKTQTTSDILGDAVNLNLNLPASTINGSSRFELKIYPNLMAHVVESIEGIIQRPYGCGEQTISSTYPSLLVLRRDKYRPVDSKLRTTARRYAEIGYKRLLDYRTADGGFAYWQDSEADLALSAYALRFLYDAADFVSVDDAVVKGLRQWLLKQQSEAGTWPARRYSSADPESDRATLMLAAFVARVLAKTGTANGGSSELRRALANLSTRIESFDEPYLIASYALAAAESGDLRGATRAAARLRQLARADGGTTFWELSTSTPFHGWGAAGRIETTALAVQALAAVAGKDEKVNAGYQSNDPLIKSGLLYLLKHKDRYGVWLSTQATINVLDTLIALLAGDSNPASGATSPLQVFVNGQPAASLSLPAGALSTGMVRADLSRFMRHGPNQIELRRSPGSAFASVQLVANYYVPWSETDSSRDSATQASQASGLLLSSTFNKTETEVNEEIVCRVKAARRGGNGYGMMLAEIGLPPGAEVDRASIESAMKTAGWGLSQYDILPDRLVVYLWPPAGGLDFTFKFRPRFAMRAKTAPSVIYDYYNPEARTVVEPVRFVVR